MEEFPERKKRQGKVGILALGFDDPPPARTCYRLKERVGPDRVAQDEFVLFQIFNCFKERIRQLLQGTK